MASASRAGRAVGGLGRSRGGADEPTGAVDEAHALAARAARGPSPRAGPRCRRCAPGGRRGRPRRRHAAGPCPAPGGCRRARRRWRSWPWTGCSPTGGPRRRRCRARSASTSAPSRAAVVAAWLPAGPPPMIDEAHGHGSQATEGGPDAEPRRQARASEPGLGRATVGRRAGAPGGEDETTPGAMPDPPRRTLRSSCGPTNGPGRTGPGGPRAGWNGAAEAVRRASVEAATRVSIVTRSAGASRGRRPHPFDPVLHAAGGVDERRITGRGDDDVHRGLPVHHPTHVGAEGVTQVAENWRCWRASTRARCAAMASSWPVQPQAPSTATARAVAAARATATTTGPRLLPTRPAYGAAPRRPDRHADRRTARGRPNRQRHGKSQSHGPAVDRTEHRGPDRDGPVRPTGAGPPAGGRA